MQFTVVRYYVLADFLPAHTDIYIYIWKVQKRYYILLFYFFLFYFESTFNEFSSHVAPVYFSLFFTISCRECLVWAQHRSIRGNKRIYIIQQQRETKSDNHQFENEKTYNYTYTRVYRVGQLREKKHCHKNTTKYDDCSHTPPHVTRKMISDKWFMEIFRRGEVIQDDCVDGLNDGKW